MKFLILWSVTDDADPDQIQSMILDEERHAWKQYKAGVLREHYKSDMPTPAISICEADDLADAEAKMRPPLYEAGLITRNIRPLEPFEIWEVLFRDEERADGD